MTHDELDSLRARVDGLEKRLDEFHSALSAKLHPTMATVEEHDDRLDEHDRQLDEVRREMRALVSAVGRLGDIATTQGLSLGRIERNVARLVEILEPRTVVVTP